MLICFQAMISNSLKNMPSSVHPYQTLKDHPVDQRDKDKKNDSVRE